MNNIKSEIIQIIQNQDFIVLPKIGMFESDYSAPYINANNELVPSNKTISFNEVLKLDSDEKLFNLLTQFRGDNKVKIKNKYDLLVDDFNSEIKSKKIVTWEGLGQFYTNSNGELNFIEQKIEAKEFNKPIEQESIKSQPSLIENYIIHKKVVDTVENQAVILNPELIDNTNFEERRDESLAAVKKDSINGLTKLLLYLLPIFILLGGLIYILFIKPNSTQDEVLVKENTNFDSTERWRTNPAKMDTVATAMKQIKNPVSPTNAITETQKTALPEKVKVEPIIENPNDIEILISIAAFVEKENLNSTANFLRSKGLPIKIAQRDKFYKVYMIAKSKEEAERLVNKVEALTDLKPVYDK